MSNSHGGLFLRAARVAAVLCIVSTLATVAAAHALAQSETTVATRTHGLNVSAPAAETAKSFVPVSAETTDTDATDHPVSAQAADAALADELNKIKPAQGEEIEWVIVEPEFLDQPGPEEVYDLILRLERNRQVYADVVLGQQKGLDAYIPLLEVARQTDIAATADLANGTVSGFYLRQNNTYLINVEEGYYTVGGERLPLPENAAFVRDLGYGLGEIYIKPGVLNEIWPLQLNLNFSRQALEINTPLKLPRELREEREKARARLEGGVEERYDDEKYIYVPNPYRLYSRPVARLDGSTNYSSDRDTFRNRLGLQGFNDLLGTQADYSISSFYDTKDGFDLTGARLRLTRQDYDGTALPFGLKKLQLGDVSTPLPDLVDRSVSGRGIVLSNVQKRRQQDFDQVTIEGPAPPGWEVELYRNFELLDFRIIGEDGLYRFEDIPLLFGNNRMRVILYGPQGQIDERVEVYNIAGGMLPPGESEFTVSAIDANRDLIPVRENNTLESGWAKTLKASYGLNKRMSFIGSLMEVPTEEDIQRYGTAGLIVTTPVGYGQVEAYKQLGGGTALDTRFNTQLAGVRLRWQGSVFSDSYESPETDFGPNALALQTELRADRNIRLPFGLLGLSLTHRFEETKAGTNRTSLTATQSLGLRRLRFSNRTTASFRGRERQNTSGTLSAVVRLTPQWQVRTLADYRLYPNSEFSRFEGEVRYQKGDFLGTFDAKRNVQESDTEFGLQGSYDFGSYLGSMELDWNPGDGFDVTLRASTNLGPFGKDNRYIASSKGLSQSIFKGQVYEDTDYDLSYNADQDRPVAEAEILRNGSPLEETDAEGYVTDLTAGSAGLSYLKVDQKTLGNPFLVSEIEGYKTVMRPGVTPFFPFPVALSGAIDGVLAFDDGRPIPGVRIQLIDDQGEVLQETVSLSDGFYSFEKVLPGEYVVRVHPEQQVNVPPRSVSVASDDLFAYGIDLHLMEQAAEAAPTTTGRDGRITQIHHAPVEAGTGQPAPLPSDGNFSAVVHQVRIGEHPYKIRLVLDLSAPAPYFIGYDEDKTSVFIDLPDIAWDALRKWRSQNVPIVQSYETEALAEGGTRLRINGWGALHVYQHVLLKPEFGRGYRLVIDLEPPRPH